MRDLRKIPVIPLLATTLWLLPLPSRADDTAPLNCASLPAPATFCTYYGATPTLKADPLVEPARKACETFFKSTEDALKLLCSYDAESKDLDAKLMSGSSKVSGSANSLGVSKETYQQAQDFWRRYRTQVQSQLVRIQTDFGQSERLLTEMSRQGIRNLREETACKKDGVPGATPGFLLAGLAVKADEEQGKIRKNVVDALQTLYEDATASGTQTRLLGNTSSLREKSQGLVPDSTGQATADQLTDTRELHGDSRETQALQGSRSVIGLAPRVWRRSGTLAIKALIDYKKYGEIDGVAMFDLGVHAVAYVTGISVGSSILLAVGLYVVEQGIRKEIAAQEQRIFGPYVQFAAGHVRAAAGITSDQIAVAYKPTKQKAPYCLPACTTSQECGSMQM